MKINLDSEMFIRGNSLGFFEFFPTTSPIERFDSFPEQVLAEFQNFVILSPLHLTSCYGRHEGNC